MIGLLRRMLNVAKRWGDVDAVPEITTVKRQSDRLEDDQWLTEEETTALIATAEPQWMPVITVAARTGLARARKAAGLARHLHTHMLRHTWASHCIKRGIPSRVVMLWGGWTSEAMLERYAHLAPREVESLIQRIGSFGGSAVRDPRWAP